MNSVSSRYNFDSNSHALDKAGLFALCVAAFASMSSMRLCDPLLPALAQTFDTTTGEAAYTISAFAVSYGLLQLFFGPLGDRYGKFRVIAVAVSCCTIGNVLAIFARDMQWLVLARALSGATAGGIIPLSLAWVGDAVSYERRQEVLGHLMVATLLGTAFGQWMSGVLVDLVGWRWPFAVMVVMFAVMGLVLRGMSRSRSGMAHAPGAGIGFTRGMVVVLRMRWARWILLLTVLEGAFAFSAVSFVPSYLHHRFTMPLSQAAAIVALFAGGGLIYALQARRMVAWMGERRLALSGSAAMGICLIGMALISHASMALPACLFAGLGFAMLHATLQTHATQMAPTVRGTATALFGASIFLGQSLGILAAAFAVDHGGFRSVFAIAGTVIIVTGYAFARSLPRT
ncbi:MAG: transporter [Panacagrimonas sp.]|nr:MFS transporter [Panacagrimonas sp.]MCC2657342.1 transporter [Panacagrimonas sp.]